MIENFLKILEDIMAKDAINFKQKIENARYICVFGAGNMFKDSKEFILGKTKIDFICDNDSAKWGKEIYGIKCISPDDLLKLNNVLVILCLGDNVEVSKYLSRNKINFINHFNLIWDMDDDNLTNANIIQEMISKTLNLFKDDESKKIFKELILNRVASEQTNLTYAQLKTIEKQYMTLNSKFQEHEIIVDCGAFDGDTAQGFIDEIDDKIEKIYAFELDRLNFEKLNTNISKGNISYKRKIQSVNAGVGNKNGNINYISTATMHTAIELSGKGEVAKMIRLDDFLEGEKITFIKMDIEGFEIEALKGAEKLIKENKPKLAICIYHKFSDLWAIPDILKTFRDDYEFILRHHSDYWSETVLYAY